MTYRKFWYYWHTRNDSDSRNGWNTSHSGHSGSWDRLYRVRGEDRYHIYVLLYRFVIQRLLVDIACDMVLIVVVVVFLCITALI